MSEAPTAPVAGPSFDDLIKAVSDGITLVKSKPWHQSLTVQGSIVASAGAFVVAYGAPILHAFGLSPDDAAELAKGAAAVSVSIGALMGIVGRLRLGGLS
jgi:hypothetical protein